MDATDRDDDLTDFDLGSPRVDGAQFRAWLDDMRRCEPYCACGRIVSRCDGSRRGCKRGGQ